MNEAQPTIPIWRTVMTAYRQGIGVLFRDGALFRYFIYATLLSLVIYGINLYRAQLLLSRSAHDPTPGYLLASNVVGVLLYFSFAVVICPFAFAMHRKILLGETPREYYLVAATSRNQLRFLLATIAVYGVFLVAAFAGHPVLYLVYGVNPFNPQTFSSATSAQPTAAVVVSGLTLVFNIIASLTSARSLLPFQQSPSVCPRPLSANPLAPRVDRRGACSSFSSSSSLSRS